MRTASDVASLNLDSSAEAVNPAEQEAAVASAEYGSDVGAINDYDDYNSDAAAAEADADADSVDDNFNNDLADFSVDLSDPDALETSAAAAASKSQASLAACSHATLPEVGEITRDRVKLMLCCCLTLVHGVALVVLDIIMMRRRCSAMLGGSFAVLAASLAVAIATTLLAFARIFGRRALICVAATWAGSLAMDGCWICLTFPQLDITNCLGTGMIGVTAVGLVSCPASLVAFVIMHGSYKTKPAAQ